MIRRLRESARPSFPPSRRDAVILGGTIFDLLETERGPDACERLALKLLPGGATPTLEAAFEARIGEIEDAWRASLRAMARPAATRRARLAAAGRPLEHFAGVLGVGLEHEDLARAAGEELGHVEAGAALQHALDPVLAEQPLDHFRLHLIRGEGDFDQLVAAATAATAVVVNRHVGPPVATAGDRFPAFLK